MDHRKAAFALIHQAKKKIADADEALMNDDYRGCVMHLASASQETGGAIRETLATANEAET